MHRNGAGWIQFTVLAFTALFMMCCSSDNSTDPIEKNERLVVEALKDYVEAQKAYRDKNGRYSENLSELGIPPEMAAASPGSLNSAEYHGYQFIHVSKNGNGKMDYRSEFVLCAVPAVYRSTGIHTFGMGPKGIVIMKDNGGKVLHNATEFADRTWRPQ